MMILLNPMWEGGMLQLCIQANWGLGRNEPLSQTAVV